MSSDRALRTVGYCLLLLALTYGSANAECISTPPLSANLTDYARCWATNQGPITNIPKDFFGISSGTGIAQDCSGGNLPANVALPPYCTASITSGNDLLRCTLCSDAWTARRLRKQVALSLCVIPAGSNRCDAAVTITPAK